MTDTLSAPGELRARCDAFRAAGARVGLVPTMGALHAGHLSLIEAVRARGAGPVVVTIFVNPLQFAEGEDLANYPRTLEADLGQLRAMDVDVAFVPKPDAMYPADFQTHVAVERVTAELEGARRPSHFQGVTTVVTKLFNLVGPCVAAFGQKDYQQLRVISTMVRDLDMPIEVVGCPIVREPDGLALSSRNRYLSPSERTRATAIYRGLDAAHAIFQRGERRVVALSTVARAPVDEHFDAVDYVALADPGDLRPIPEVVGERASLLVAARIGATRLIDNTVLGDAWPQQPETGM